MKEPEKGPARTDPDPETADRNPLHAVPGDVDETETAEARETRVSREEKGRERSGEARDDSGRTRP